MTEKDVENPIPELKELFETWKKKDTEKDQRIEDLEIEIESLKEILEGLVNLHPLPELTRTRAV